MIFWEGGLERQRAGVGRWQRRRDAVGRGGEVGTFGEKKRKDAHDAEEKRGGEARCGSGDGRTHGGGRVGGAEKVGIIFYLHFILFRSRYPRKIRQMRTQFCWIQGEEYYNFCKA
jgi:hypothetical protein